MLKKDELYKQSLQDLLRVVVILSEILEQKELTDEENNRINYGTKVLNDVTRIQKKINKIS